MDLAGDVAKALEGEHPGNVVYANSCSTHVRPASVQGQLFEARVGGDNMEERGTGGRGAIHYSDGLSMYQTPPSECMQKVYSSFPGEVYRKKDERLGSKFNLHECLVYKETLS